MAERERPLILVCELAELMPRGSVRVADIQVVRLDTSIAEYPVRWVVGIAVDALLAYMRPFAVLQLAGQAGIAAALPVEAVVRMCVFRVHKMIGVGEDIEQLAQHRRFVLSAVSPASEADTAGIAVAAVAAADMHSVAVAVGYTVETVDAEM